MILQYRFFRWSFGILVWEIMTLGGTPYPSVPHQELFDLLRSGCRMEKPHQCSEDIYDLMRACWNQQPEHRPSFAKIVEYLDFFLTQANPDVSTLYFGFLAKG